MFNFFRKKKNSHAKKQGNLDKIVTGAIVGVAIGSVLGVSMAPKKGSETRKDVADSTKGIMSRVKSLLSKSTKLPQKARFKKHRSKISLPEEM